MASAVESLPIVGNHPKSEVRSCETTSLPVCLTAQRFMRWHAVVAVVSFENYQLCLSLLGHIFRPCHSDARLSPNPHLHEALPMFVVEDAAGVAGV